MSGRRRRNENKSSAIAEMDTQCCTSRIFAFEWRVPLFNALFL